MKVEITILSENTVAASVLPITGEHGLSFFVKAGDQKFLFDTGQGQVLVHNAKHLGIDLGSVETVILSHGHYDHAGGLGRLLEINSGFRLVAHPSVFESKLACLGEDCYPIGMSTGEQQLKEAGVKLELSRDPVRIGPGIMTTGEIPMTNDFEQIEPMFFVDTSEGRKQDTLPDDNALVIDTESGIVVVLGCAHRGVVNTLTKAVSLAGKDKIHAVLGGMHLFLADEERIKKVTQALERFEVERMIIGHCTGFPAMAALAQAFPGRLIPASVGQRFEF